MPKGIDGNYDIYEHLTEKRSALERWEAHLLSIANPLPTANEDHQNPYSRRQARNAN
jgi:hypothetical protein